MFYTRTMVLTAHPGPVDNGMQTAMQTSLFGSGAPRCAPVEPQRIELDGRSAVLFQPGWFEGSESLFERLRIETAWRSMQRPMYDRMVDVPRLISTVDPAELDHDHGLRLIHRALESAFSTTFSSIGLNFYRTGDDSVAWHRDSIGRTGTPTTVVLVSLGAPRTLAVRRWSQTRSKTAETTRSPVATTRRWRLGHGDLLAMIGRCQHDWEHSVPKERAVGPRISLAFRSKEAPEGPRIEGSGVPPLLASHKLR